MTSLQELGHYISLVSGLFLIAGYVPYIWDTIKGKTVPDKISWLCWSLTTGSVFFSLLSIETSIRSLWLPAADALGCLIVFIISLWYGTGKPTFLERVCIAISIVAIATWFATGSPTIAFTANLTIYVIGYFPTIVKLLKNPTSESKVGWTLFSIGIPLDIIALILNKEASLLSWIYIITLAVTVAMTTALTYRKIRVVSPRRM